MSDTVLTALQYYGAGAALVAAFVVSLNISTRVTGWAFVLFVTSSIALVAWGFLKQDAEGIGWQNIGLLIINIVGVYRYLIAAGGNDDGSRLMCRTCWANTCVAIQPVHSAGVADHPCILAVTASRENCSRAPD